jgi:hypothetical protein
MPPRPKQQHYVTRAYLEGFLAPGHEHLFCYGRHRPSSFQSRPSELARERSYYSFREPGGTWNDSLEREIEQRVETPGIDVVRTLASGSTRLDWPQRDALAMLMAVQRFRVPHLRQLIDASHANMIEELLSEYDRMQRERGPGRMWIRSIRPGTSPSDRVPGRAYVSREELEAMQRSLQDDPGQFSRETLFGIAVEFANMFRRMKWIVHYSNYDASIITSDCPVLLWHEQRDVEHAGINRSDAHVEFPLSRTSLLSMTHDFALISDLKHVRTNRERRRILQSVPEIKIAEADAEQVRIFNTNQAQYCSRWTFSGREYEWLINVLRERSRNVRQRITHDGEFIKLESLIG